MNDLNAGPRGYRVRDWHTHLSKIIDEEIKRRGLTVRELQLMGAIKTRGGFYYRLREKGLNSGEMEGLLDKLKIDMNLAVTTFLSPDPFDAYKSTSYTNITRLMEALLQRIEHNTPTELTNMEPLRQKAIEVLAEMVIQKMLAHLRCVDDARNKIMVA